LGESAVADPLPQDSIPEKVTYSEWIAQRLWVEYGAPFTFEGRPYLKKVHDLEERKLLLRCVTGDTRITTAGGKSFTMEELVRAKAVGTEVLTYNDNRHRLEVGRITAIHLNGRRKVGALRLEDGSRLTCTPEHRVWTQKIRWVPAERAARGPITGKKGIKNCRVAVVRWGGVKWVHAVGWEDLGEEEVYDLTVSNGHSYVANGIIVHNCGRQVEKTSTLAAKLVSWSCLKGGWKSLYVSPSQKQTRVFSHSRLDRALTSPFVRARYFDPKRCVDDVYEKTYLNGSTTWLSYANTNADRARGISSDLLLADEIQDMLIDVFPVLEETLSHSYNPYQVYAGTPKTLNNSMEAHWKNSTQCEWLVHCLGCGDWVYQDERVVRKEGPCCPKCGRALDPQFGRWEPYGPTDAEFAGFRIPQTIVPWIAGIPSKWAELYRKHEKWPQQQFYNEVLGLAHEKGANPLTEADLKKCCAERGMYEHRPQDLYFDALYAGVDWGAGIRSFTVLTIIGQNSDKLHVLYVKRFAEERGEPGAQVEEITRICQRFGVVMVGCDWGGGFVQNHQLALDLTGHADVIQFYESGTKKRDIVYEKRSRLYVFNRNAGLYSVIDGVKAGLYVFPRWEQFSEFAEDFTCVFEDWNQAMRMMTLDHPQDTPDDAMHSLLFATCAFRVARGMKAFS